MGAININLINMIWISKWFEAARKIDNFVGSTEQALGAMIEQMKYIHEPFQTVKGNVFLEIGTDQDYYVLNRTI
ncbi:MAG: hypothetical protein ACXV7F_07120 [Methylomonas sp.]